jgi:hypothetical protein
LWAPLATVLLGCGDEQTVIPTAEFTEAEKQAIQAEDAKIAELESHGTVNKKKKK